MKRLIIVTVTLIVLFGLSAIPSMASTFTPITQPDAEYVASTTKIDISGLTYGSSYDSISDGSLTVSFDNPLGKLGPVPTGWATWSSPPYSESANPDVLFTNGEYDLTMTLSQPCTTFGFELEPNPFTDEDYDVDFILMSGPTVVGTITMTVNGDHGARLFAGRVDGGSFDKIVIEGSREFAIAQIRYALPAPTIRCRCPNFYFFAATEDGENPESQTMTIYNFGVPGCAPLEWTVSDGADWLTLSPTSGTTMRTMPGDQVEISVDISDMSAGRYFTWITVEAPGATNSPQRVPVFLHIRASYGTFFWL